ncbi:hypothetical protein DYB30_009569 [Aphanomyces astaci]|uniref:GAG-pre-integrase domain-containing protein n=1 Tax=Aphanomyces astaci TaxID=112090 RepID=A0A397DWQ2_APHAT|nr:hypothetical protein DYB30_009569 [Aphanomyces astaci]
MTPNSLQLWHRRLGHPGVDAFEQMTKTKPELILFKAKHLRGHLCETCAYAKSKRSPFDSFADFRAASNLALDTPRVSPDSLKNKLRNLRTEFVAIQRSLTATGNDEQTTPAKPGYYADMLVAFADLHGLGDIEFGMDRAASASLSEDNQGLDTRAIGESVSMSSMRDAKRKDEIDMEIQRQRQVRGKKQQPDLAVGLSNLGEALASGLIEAAKLKCSHNSGVDIANQMAKMFDLMQETKASIDKTNEVND